MVTFHGKQRVPGGVGRDGAAFESRNDRARERVDAHRGALWRSAAGDAPPLCRTALRV